MSHPEAASPTRGERAAMPNFLVIGAQKAGTTALYNHLKQHPQVYMSPVKEPHFFAYEGEKLNFQGPRDLEIMKHMVVSDLGDYEALFEAVSGEKAAGEASAMYLYSEKAPQRIRHYVPRIKLVAVLRDPAERAYSSFLHMIRDGREPLADFGEALDAEQERIRENWGPIWHYKSMGFYHEQLSRYYAAFEPEQIKVYLYEDLNDDPSSVLKDLYSFLDVDDSFVPDVSARYNASGVPRNERLHTLHHFLLRPNSIKEALKPLLPKRLRQGLRASLVNTLRNRNLVKPPFPEGIRSQLVEEYREDVTKLQALIGRDLSGWL